MERKRFSNTHIWCMFFCCLYFFWLFFSCSVTWSKPMECWRQEGRGVCFCDCNIDLQLYAKEIQTVDLSFQNKTWTTNTSLFDIRKTFDKSIPIERCSNSWSLETWFDFFCFSFWIWPIVILFFEHIFRMQTNSTIRKDQTINQKINKYDEIVKTEAILKDWVCFKCENCWKIMTDRCFMVSKARYMISRKQERSKYICKNCV